MTTNLPDAQASAGVTLDPATIGDMAILPQPLRISRRPAPNNGVGLSHSTPGGPPSFLSISDDILRYMNENELTPTRVGTDPTKKPDGSIIQFNMTYRGHRRPQVFIANSTGYEMASMIEEFLQIPINTQKIFVPGTRRMQKMSDRLHQPITDLEGKEVVLYGSTEEEMETFHDEVESRVQLDSDHDRMAVAVANAIKSLNRRLVIAARITASAPAKPLQEDEIVDGEDVESVESLRRCFGKLVEDKQQVTERVHLEGLIGTGTIPRLRCIHFGTDPRLSCQSCRYLFLIDWHSFVVYIATTNLQRILAQDANGYLISELKDLYDQAITRIASLKTDLDAEFVAARGGGALYSELHDMCDLLDLEGLLGDNGEEWLANDAADGVHEDLLSFYTAMTFLA